MRPEQTWTSMSSYRSTYISFHLFTWDRPKTNSERSDFVSVADPTRVIFVPIGDCTVLMKNGNESQSGSTKYYVSLYGYIIFAFFLAK